MNKLKTTLLAAGLLVTSSAQATIVEVQTSAGNFQINLFDSATPKTVENFLSYVNDESYSGVVFHRLEPNFVLQGGGFKYTDEFDPITAKGTVDNEPVYSNVRGTVAMAKVANDPNSATNQWFINLGDNSTNLDVQNGGFTVFGQVIGDGMNVIEQMSSYACGGVPMVNTTAQDCTDLLNENITLGSERLITINYVSVIDSNTDTASNLTPKENTLIDDVDTTPPSSSDSSGGSMGPLIALLSGLFIWRRRSIK